MFDTLLKKQKLVIKSSGSPKNTTRREARRVNNIEHFYIITLSKKDSVLLTLEIATSETSRVRKHFQKTCQK